MPSEMHLTFSERVTKDKKMGVTLQSFGFGCGRLINDTNTKSSQKLSNVSVGFGEIWVERAVDEFSPGIFKETWAGSKADKSTAKPLDVKLVIGAQYEEKDTGKIKAETASTTITLTGVYISNYNVEFSSGMDSAGKENFCLNFNTIEFNVKSHDENAAKGNNVAGYDIVHESNYASS